MDAIATTERPVTAGQLDRLAAWSMRKPVIALMGEFSAGKSTLMNLLIGQNILPTQVTATRMPPVWLRYGEGEPYRIDHAGKRHKVDFANTGSIPVNTTRFVRLFCKADILQRCDLIDTPGISDPNIKADAWMRTVGYANAVMWCSHAGQAWRESERGTWESLPTRLRQTSILLVTKKDKISSESDLTKIDRRLARETSGLFNARMFVSLTNALRAREAGDARAWADSGAQGFADMLEQIVEGVGVQRSFMLARYVVGDGQAVTARAEPQAEQQIAPDTAGILGFVAQEVTQPVPAPQPQPAVIELAEPVAEPAALVWPEVEVEQTEIAVQGEAHATIEAVMAQIAATEAQMTDPAAVPPEAAPEQEDGAAEETDPENDIRIKWSSWPGMEFSGYRLKAPGASVEARRVELSNYRLRDPSQRKLAAQEAPAEAAAQTAPAEEPRQGSEHRRQALAAATPSELDRTRQIWTSLREQHDLSQTPRLVETIERLIAELEARPALTERRQATA